MEPICAPATPLFASALSIVRVSGVGLRQALKPLLDMPEPRVASLRRLNWAGYSECAIVVFFPAPRSYTGQDVAEFHLHGNPLLVKRFLEHLGQLGIRRALPGEFTQRALLNGKQDVFSAEALHDLMAADTDIQLMQAQARAGGVPPWLREAKAKIAHWVALAEASVDYGEDEGIALDIRSLAREADGLKAMFHVEQTRSNAAHWLRSGIKIAIVGRPNAGKSTLFNALAGEERAIVTEIPGTTRDVIEVACEWAGLALCLYDTAGLRVTGDPIEQLGVAKVELAMQSADLILHLIPVFDEQADPEVLEHIKPYRDKTIAVRSQCDLPPSPAMHNFEQGINISAARGDLGQLENALKDRFLGGLSPYACLGALATSRQKDLLTVLADQMGLIAELPDNAPPELSASLLQGAWSLMARLTGEDRADTALDIMFSSFCLGK